ncbi:hypothetical protein B0P06_002487 [Clostridium saccharoperbutylacetonicum]|uniref:O-antigen polymerase n=1 Tax=Clostridium saccharoperbutylacetonicum N1-4(HMT) TaxID=931276 RepID=M1MMR2_9CLOT|nr:O-antigen ligase family protein [Clostridium saccharoperbutylacetonicum]AGF59179.1 O-antigen polymerase [Clostridium saccharoperbutylacetonicum N1-4(HMT)]NRT60034.1 hypothetical protein [Clostridium saccharoperbutylacetonicum]NSB23346.1 hypothetical protein [Clostridium saccharoperbutylacetonicum]NSB42716.1 hypothetical protein [Clostridium saccharoperbutylacetonicum]
MDKLRNNSKDKSYNFFLPIAVILSIVPLIVRMTNVNVDENVANIWGSTTQVDLFSQKKAFLLMFFSIILILLSIVFFKKIFNKKDKVVNLILISTGVFFLFILLSSIFSKYQEVSFWGMFDRAEGFITISCYLIIFLYSIYTFKNTNNYKYIIIPILIIVFINAFLGLFQYIGQDLIATPLGKLMVVPSEYFKTTGNLTPTIQEHTLYGTFINYNYMGSFVSIVLPILFCYTIFEDEILYKILSFIGTLLSFWLLFGSSARSGLVGVFGSLIFGSILFWKPIKKHSKYHWKKLLIGFLSLIVILVGVNFASHGSILRRLPTLTSDISEIFKSTSDFDYTDHTPIKDIKYEGSTTEIVLPNNADTLKITYETGNPVFKNSKNEIVPYTLNGKVLTTNYEAFRNFTFAFGKLDSKSVMSDTLLLNIDNQPRFIFKLNDVKTFHLMDMSTKKFIDLQYPETFGFKGKEKLGSARGYIWSRSIPLLKNTIILGNGPDTFPFVFPQGELIAKYYALDTPNITVDKAHNLYLQMALNYGVIALLAFLIITITYLVDSFKLYAFKENYDLDKQKMLGAITSLGVLGYLVTGFFNDSVVSVAPVFWIVFGVGVALNFMNRETLRKLSK